MDWGLGNPNSTAAVIATLMIAVWFVAFLWRRGFWISLILFTILGSCLIHTFSRGGLLALFAGVVPLLWTAPRPWPRTRVVAVGIAVVAMIGFSIYLKANQRFVQGITQEDRSITHRLELWKHAPAMIVDAPQGWGLGKAAEAYMQWYQPLEDSKAYRTFVNTHLEFLIEIGWVERFAYVFGWIAVFLICWPDRKHSKWMAVPFGIWSAFAVAGAFSSVTEAKVVWVVPILALLTALTYRILRRKWLRPMFWIIPSTGAAFACLVLYLLGSNGSSLEGSPERVTIGDGPSALWIVIDKTTLGQQYGKTLRRYLAANPRAPSVGVVFSVAEIPEDGRNSKVVVAGQVPDTECPMLAKVAASAANLLLLTPNRYPQELSIGESQSGVIQAVFGEFSQSPYAVAWEESGKIRRIPGAGDFLPSWPELVLQEQL